jgi:glucokinase
MKRAVLVNGVPASGKSTVARAVSDTCGWPLFAVDTIKLPFFDEIGPMDRAFNRKLGRAAYAAIFETVANFPDPCTVIAEAWFGFQPTDVLERHLTHAGIGEAVQLWCHAPPEVIGERYGLRVPLRPPQHPGLDYVPELIALAERAVPLAQFPVLAVDTTKPLDMAAVVVFLRGHGFQVT